jgi:hypothetical protein
MAGFVEGVDRGQSTLFPALLDYVAEDNPVRAVDVFVDGLDLDKLGFLGVQPLDTGRPGYHPRVMLKLYIYGYLNRVPSSRRLEREVVALSVRRSPTRVRARNEQFPSALPGHRGTLQRLGPGAPHAREEGAAVDLPPPPGLSVTWRAPSFSQLIDPRDWWPMIVRTTHAPAASAGRRDPALLVAPEVARHAAAPGAPETPWIAVWRLSRRGHRLRCQRRDGQSNNDKDTHRISPEARLQPTIQRFRGCERLTAVGAFPIPYSQPCHQKRLAAVVRLACLGAAPHRRPGWVRG